MVWQYRRLFHRQIPLLQWLPEFCIVLEFQFAIAFVLLHILLPQRRQGKSQAAALVRSPVAHDGNIEDGLICPAFLDLDGHRISASYGCREQKRRCYVIDGKVEAVMRSKDDFPNSLRKNLNGKGHHFIMRRI